MEGFPQLPFLDTLLKRKDDSSLDITVYRKPTHTDRYLNFQSHHPVHVKRGLVRCLYDRAKNIVCSQDGLRKEEKHFAAVLKNSARWFHRQIFKAHHQGSGRRRGYPRTSSNSCHTICCGYELRICRGHNIRVAFRSSRTLRSMLSSVKDKVPTDCPRSSQGCWPYPEEVPVCHV